MEEAVLSADEAPANTQTLGPEQTPEGCQPENSLQFQAPRNGEGKFLKGQFRQSGRQAARYPQPSDNDCRAIVRWRLRRGITGSARQSDEWRQRRAAAHRHPPHWTAPATSVSFALSPLQNAADVAPAIAAIIAAAAEGAISTAEACEMSQVVERYSRALAAEEIETRLQRLESACGLAQ